MDAHRFFMEVSAAFVCFCDICMATSGSEPVSGSQCPIETRRRAAKGHWDPETGCKAKIMGKIGRLPWILVILLENQRFWTCGNHLSWGGVGKSSQNDEIWCFLKAFHKESGRLLESWKSGGFLDISEHSSKSMEIHQNPWKSIKINENHLKSTKTYQNRWKPIKIDRNRSKSLKVYESRLNRPQDLEIHNEWNPSPSPGIPPCESPPAGEGRAGKFVVTLQPGHGVLYRRPFWGSVQRHGSGGP